jgi:hypothetical protein
LNGILVNAQSREKFGDLLDVAELDRVQGAVLVAQLERADRDLLDRAPDTAAEIDIFADPERVVDQEERARQDVVD